MFLPAVQSTRLDPAFSTSLHRLLPLVQVGGGAGGSTKEGRTQACSLLNLRGGPAAGGDTPASPEEMHEWRHLNLGAPD